MKNTYKKPNWLVYFLYRMISKFIAKFVFNTHINRNELKNVKAEVIEESSCENAHKGYACIKVTDNPTDENQGKIYHTFNNLIEGQYYRVSVYAQTNTQMKLTAKNLGRKS